jgi:type I restriction enzyme S subunit
MRDSGVDWLGKVPAHWEVKSLRYVIDAIGDVDHFMPQSVESGVPYLMTGDLKDRLSEVSLEECKQVGDSDYLQLSRKIRTSKGDVVMARYATIGTVMYVDLDMELLVSYSCVTLKPARAKMSGMYLFQYMKSDAFRQGVEHRINTNTQSNVGISDLQAVKVAVPPIDEQAAIAAFLSMEGAKVDALVAESERGVSLLNERRSALISAAVTGKIDVCGLVPQPKAVAA